MMNIWVNKNNNVRQAIIMNIKEITVMNYWLFRELLQIGCAFDVKMQSFHSYKHFGF
uniref:Uncharacterized protein n=1 Tax=Rhizophora mucronata TaxID=61149 RepID=A0A2P2MJQ7_RHIMU